MPKVKNTDTGEEIEVSAGEELKEVVKEAGFEQCKFYNLLNGVVAIHKAK